MKEVIKEKTVSYSMWEAMDGTPFNDKAECEKYENSAWGVLFARLKKFVINEGSPCVLGLDCEDGTENEYVVIEPKTVEDLNTANHLLAIAGNSCSLNEDDLNTPIFFGYRVYQNNVDWCWFYRIADIVNKATKGGYIMQKVNS